MAMSRFGELRYNKNLDEYQEGRFRATAKTVFDKRIIKALPELINMQTSPVLDDILKDRFEKAKALNPDLQYEEFKKLTISNIKATLAETSILLLITGLLMGLDDDDPTNDTLTERFLIRAFSRTSDELSFWYDANSFSNVIQSPIPLIGLVRDVNGLLGETKDLMWGLISGEEVETEVWKKSKRIFIGTNAYEKFMRELERVD